MLYVKIMSDQDLPDTNPWHTYSIITVADRQKIQFVQNNVPEGQVGNYPGMRYSLIITDKDGISNCEEYPLTGNVYILNEAGKTIASHGC